MDLNLHLIKFLDMCFLWVVNFVEISWNWIRVMIHEFHHFFHNSYHHSLTQCENEKIFGMEGYFCHLNLRNALLGVDLIWCAPLSMSLSFYPACGFVKRLNWPSTSLSLTHYRFIIFLCPLNWIISSLPIILQSFLKLWWKVFVNQGNHINFSSDSLLISWFLWHVNLKFRLLCLLHYEFVNLRGGAR